MINLFNKAMRFFKKTINDIKCDLKFSYKLALYRLIGNLSNRLHLRRIGKAANKAKDKSILSYLKKELSPTIDEINTCPDNGTFIPNAPIWVCWWTGEESAPPLVKRCIRSIRENAGEHPVNFIDQFNYHDYLEIPEHIISKVESKQICLANFSDYLRVSLVNKFGGLWIDSTVFVSDNIPEEYFSLPFFTSKSPEEECGYVSRMRWTSFILGGWQNNLFFKCMQKMFTAYWANHNLAIDYLLVDYLIEIAYTEIPSIKNLIDNVPLNNTHRDNLQDAMYKAFPAYTLNNVLVDDTILYKLSWRESFSTVTADGNESIYKYFINA